MLIRLDGVGPLYLQLYRSLRAAIVNGVLPPGTRLPSTRSVAAEAGVARITAILCFEQLHDEGYVLTRKGSGTYVVPEIPDEAPLVAASDDVPGTRRRTTPRLSDYGRCIVADRSPVPDFPAPAPSAQYDFRYWRPAVDDFPLPLWRNLLNRRSRRLSADQLGYGSPSGSLELREAIAAYVRDARGVRCTPERILIVSGSQQGLDLIARVLLNPGNAVLLEEPHYPGARRVFTAAGARLIPAPVDAEGLNLPAAGSVARHARLAYVTPSHQFPSGAVMSLPRRLALLGWAERCRAYVLEDDYDSEYRYSGRPVQSLQGLDRTGRVIYMGTFSKLLFPALRLGYLILPEELIRPFVTAKALASLGGTGLEQLVLADFIREGHFGRHLRRARARNRARRDALLDAIRVHLGEDAEVSGGEGGLHLLLWLRGVRPSHLASLRQRAESLRVDFDTVAPYYMKPPPRAGLLLRYAALTSAQIHAGIERLAEAVAAVRQRRAGSVGTALHTRKRGVSIREKRVEGVYGARSASQ